MELPPVSSLRQFDTHRLVPSRHLRGGASVLREVADSEADLQAILELDGATNDRLLGEQRLLPGIGPEELVFGIPCSDVINAAFCHANPLGSRFNGPDRGAWYAAFELETSQAEVGFHRAVQLAEVGRFDDTVTYDDYLADVSAGFHDLRKISRGMACVPRRAELRRLAGARRSPARTGVARRRLSERAPQGWHLCQLLPPGAGDQRAAKPNLQVHVDRFADANDNGGARGPIGQVAGRSFAREPQPRIGGSTASRASTSSHWACE